MEREDIMAALLVLALSLQAVAPSGDRTPLRFLDQSLAAPIAIEPTEVAGPWDPLALEIVASLGIGVGMLALGTTAGALFPSGGDVGGALAPIGFFLASLLTPLVSATAVWGIEGRARPGRPWWPVFLTSFSTRLAGVLLTFVALFQVQRDPLFATALGLGGVAVSFVGGTVGEVIAARWGREAPPKAPLAIQLTAFRVAF